MTSMDADAVSMHLSRVASLLDNLHSISQLAELRTAVSAAISNYKSAQVKHEYLEPMLEAAANVWNASLAMSDADPATDATLKQASLDFQWAAFENPTKLPLTHQLRLAEHAFKTAEIWGELEEWEAVDAALGRGLALSSALSAAATAPAGENGNADVVGPHSTQERCALVFFNSLLLRLKASVRLGQELPANALLLKLKQLTNHASIPLRQRTMFSLDLLATLVSEGEHVLEVNTSKLAIQIMQAAYDAYTSLPSATPELQAVGLAEDAENLGTQALILLCWAQISSNSFESTTLDDVKKTDASQILKYVHALQKHSSRTADSVAVHFLAHQALQNAGRMQEAETELLKLVTHESVTADTCAFAIKSALLVPGGAESARAALAAAQDLTSVGDVSLIIELIEAVLGPSSSSQDPGNGAPAAAADSSHALGGGPPTAADEVILDLLEDEALKESLENDPKSMETLHILCWNRACALLEADAPDWARKFFTAALLYIDAEKNQEIVLQSQMALCLCSNTQGDYTKALGHLKSCSNGGIELDFLRLQTTLAAKDALAAAAAMKSLADHPDCDVDMLRVLCCEALDAGLVTPAKDALSLLLQKLHCSDDEGKDIISIDENDKNKNNSFPAGYEAVVFQNLIQFELDTLETALKATENLPENEENEPAEDSIESAFENLANILELLVKRMKAVRVEELFQCEDGAWSQLEWMQITAWNAGYHAGRGYSAYNKNKNNEIKKNRKKFSGRLMACCGHLCAAHPCAPVEILRKQQVAFTLAATAIIECAKDASSAAPAGEYLEHARCAVRAVDVAHGEKSVRDDKIKVYIYILEFALAVKQSDPETANAAVEGAKGLEVADAESFLRMAAFLEGQNSTHPCSVSRKAAMKAALERLTSQPELNYAAVAGVIRSLLEICSTDTDRLSTLQDAAALISATCAQTTAGTACYPPLEARYLITVAWNRGATHSKFARMKEAEAFMGVALRILSAASKSNTTSTEEESQRSGQHIGFSAEERKMMSEEYERVQAAAGNSGQDGKSDGGEPEATLG